MICPPDEELFPLLADEPLEGTVDAHFNHCTHCQRRLSVLRSEVGELRSLTSDGRPPSVPAAEKRPPFIGRYIVVGLLDAGGQAIVYRAVHPTLEKELVVKLGRLPTSGDGELNHLLISEGKLLAGLDHPNLVRVYDLDFFEGRPFLVMEYVRGRTLQAWVEAESAAPREAAAVAVSIARGLEAIHRSGIVHQDLTPRNILIDPNGEPRLIDFGLARFRHAWDGTESPSGGTPGFMAPEQAQGRVDRIGIRTDLFALGGVLYCMLTRSAPFQGRTSDEIRTRTTACDFDRAALRKAGVPHRLETICLRAMAAAPADRYPSAAAFAADLEQYLRGPSRRRFIAAGIVGLALGGAWYFSRRELEPLPIRSNPIAPILEIQVNREGLYLRLEEALPLNTDRDRIRIVGKVPVGRQPVLYSLSPRGRAFRLDAELASADSFTRIIFPAEGGQVPFDLGTGGTEFVLLCTGLGKEPPPDLGPLIESTLGELPRLPERVLVHLDHDETRRRIVSPLGAREPDPVADVEYRLDRLRTRLRDRCDVILGVAFTHRRPENSEGKK